MKPAERQEWILEYLRKRGTSTIWAQVDIYNKDFAEAYADATGVSQFAQFYGAPVVPALGRDLSIMHKNGKLLRFRIGLPGMESGFARWVYCYKLHPRYEALFGPKEESSHAHESR